MTPFEFISEPELARISGIRLSALKALRIQGRLSPVGTVSTGRRTLRVYLPSAIDELRDSRGKFSYPQEKTST